MASVARTNRFSSHRSCSRIPGGKKFVLFLARWPSGFNKPAEVPRFAVNLHANHELKTVGPFGTVAEAATSRFMAASGFPDADVRRIGLATFDPANQTP